MHDLAIYQEVLEHKNSAFSKTLAWDLAPVNRPTVQFCSTRSLVKHHPKSQHKKLSPTPYQHNIRRDVTYLGQWVGGGCTLKLGIPCPSCDMLEGQEILNLNTVLQPTKVILQPSEIKVKYRGKF